MSSFEWLEQVIANRGASKYDYNRFTTLIDSCARELLDVVKAAANAAEKPDNTSPRVELRRAIAALQAAKEEA